MMYYDLLFSKGLGSWKRRPSSPKLIPTPWGLNYKQKGGVKTLSSQGKAGA